MTYNVFGGTLSFTQSVSQSALLLLSLALCSIILLLPLCGGVHCHVMFLISWSLFLDHSELLTTGVS